MELVKITWLDTEDFKGGTWASTDEVHEFSKKQCLIESVGWIVKRSRHYVTICSDFSADPDTHGRVSKIAKRMITKMETLQLATPAQCADPSHTPPH